MKKAELQQFHKMVSKCATVTLDEHDDRDELLAFKVACGENLLRIEKAFVAINEFASEKARELIDPSYPDYENAMNKENPNIEALAKHYSKAILSYEAYQEWLIDYMDSEAVPIDLVKFPFDKVPSNLAGGFIVSIKLMLDGYPKS